MNTVHGEIPVPGDGPAKEGRIAVYTAIGFRQQTNISDNYSVVILIVVRRCAEHHAQDDTPI